MTGTVLKIMFKWALLIALVFYAGMVGAQVINPKPVPELSPGCHSQTVIDKQLSSENYKLNLMLISDRGWVINIYTNNVSGTWALIRVLPDGCGYGLDSGRVFGENERVTGWQ